MLKRALGIVKFAYEYHNSELIKKDLADQNGSSKGIKSTKELQISNYQGIRNHT